MNNLTETIDKMAYRNFDNNKIILTQMRDKITTKFLQQSLPENIFIESLYKSKLDIEWLKAQCQAARNQINKIIDPKSNFHKFYDPILKECDLILLTQELIHDLHFLDSISEYQINFEGRTSRPSHLESGQFFLHAKFAYFSQKFITPTTNRNFLFSSMPTLIRQAIEIKIKNMIGLEGVKSKKGGFKMVAISNILEFFNESPIFLELPISITTLSAINRWTNTFVHSGVVPFCWQSLEAIDLIEPLFSIKNEGTGEINISGFSYFSKKMTLQKIKEALDAHFDAVFTLNENIIEGGRKN